MQKKVADRMDDRLTSWRGLTRLRGAYRVTAIAVAVSGVLCVPFAAPVVVLCVTVGCIIIELLLLSAQRRRGRKLTWQNMAVLGLLFAAAVTAGVFPWWCGGTYVAVDLEIHIYYQGAPLAAQKLSFIDGLNGTRIDTITDGRGAANVTLDATEWECYSVLGITTKRLELSGIECQFEHRQEKRIWLGGRRLRQYASMAFRAAPYRLVVRRAFRGTSD